MVFGSITLTASVDHHTNEDLSMIDEGDDCAYVIGNNVRHSGQFQKFYIKFLFCYLISIPIVLGYKILCITVQVMQFMGKKKSDLNASNLF